MRRGVELGRLVPRCVRAMGGVALVTLASTTASAQARRPPPPRPRPPSRPAEPAGPKTVEVTVVEVAGSRAYLQPGARSEVRRNATVVLKGKEYRIVQASDSYAVIEVGEDPVHEKDKGRASIVAEEEDKVPELPAPRPLSTWEHAWTPEAPPAGAQEPRYVPLGAAERDRRYDVTLSLSGGGVFPVGSQPGASIAFAQLGARAHLEPFAAPAALDFDGSLQQWTASDLSGRVGGTTRSVFFVRELVASYRTAGFYGGIGRMKYAASTLGTLDGARAEAPLAEGISVGAFGGFLPNPLGGDVSFTAQRFGVEGRFRRPDLDLRPEAALVVHGSTFGGALDERRVSGMFGVYPGPSRFGGHFEVSAFDPDNPWRAAPVEVTAAGLDQSVRIGSLELGARADLLQPERSRWLASFLPTSWLCRTVPAAGGTSTLGEPCDGRSTTRGLGSLTAGWTMGNLALVAGATAMGDVPKSGGAPRIFGGFATGRVVRIARYLRLEASANYSVGDYLDMFGGTFGPGLTLLEDALDVSVYYRLAEIQYSAVSTSVQQDGFGGTVVFFPSSTLMFTAQGEAITGDDVKAITVFGTMAWRPRL